MGSNTLHLSDSISTAGESRCSGSEAELSSDQYASTKCESTTSERSRQFAKHWRSCTTDNNITLHGFRRFKTAHLLNLRILEDEIAEMDHKIYQAGLHSGIEPTSEDRLGLKHGRKDPKSTSVDEVMNSGFILQLRSLVQQYGMCLDSRFAASA
jgi:hypothetical protein